jgi:transcriptional regulator with XRE-family HTH domain
MTDVKAIGERIALLRKQKGLTGEKFAELLNVSPQAVSKWETGKNLPETALLSSISEALCVSVDSILTPPRIKQTEINSSPKIIVQNHGGSKRPRLAISNGVFYCTFTYTPNIDSPLFIGDNDTELRIMTSTDGISWTKPTHVFKKEGYALYNSSVLALADGSILALFYLYKNEPSYKKAMLEKVLEPFVHEEPDADYRGEISYLVGQYAIISKDGGATFSEPYLVEKNCALVGKSIQLDDGTILLPMCRYGNDPAHDGVAVIYSSRDGGVTWEPYSFVCGPIKGCSPEEFGLIVTDYKRMSCFIRTSHTMHYCISKDYGLTWSEPADSKIPSSAPFEALKLPNNKIMLTYARRDIEPLSLRMIITDECTNGISPEREQIIADGCCNAIAYHCAEFISDNSVLIIY